ncbi:MAG TPA: hypothetical protein VF281_03760 [Candidatus Saccharimonadales bacterium]
MQLNKPLIIIVGLAVLLLSIAGWYFSRPMGTVEFALAPHTVTLKLAGKEQTIEHGQDLKLKPGKYEVSFTSDNFQTDSRSIVVEDKKTIKVIVALTPLNDAGKKQLDNSESKKVIEAYRQQQYEELIASLPLSGVNYSITACPSIKEPKSDTKAVCIITKTAAGETAARESLQQLGYDLDNLPIIVGSENTKKILATDTYRIEYYVNTKIEGATKPALFVIPINPPAVNYAAPYNVQLETLKSTVLADLKVNGYTVDNYDIYYSNVYLSRYNPVTHVDESDAHYSAPLPAN